MPRYFVVFVMLALMISTGGAAETDVYRVIIKFGSVCCGIDLQAKEQISRILSEHEKENGVFFGKQLIYWGEEGEVNLCLKPNGTSAAEQEKLISRLRAAIRDPELVKLEENALCKAGW